MAILVDLCGFPAHLHVVPQRFAVGRSGRFGGNQISLDKVQQVQQGAVVLCWTLVALTVLRCEVPAQYDGGASANPSGGMLSYTPSHKRAACCFPDLNAHHFWGL